MMAIAEPVSNAMGALFQIEKSGGASAATSGPVALEAVRRALGMLQQQPSNHPAVQLALEAVAGSLGLVHGLAAAKPAAPAPVAAPQAAPYAQPTQSQAAYPAQQAYPAPQAGYAPPAPAYPQGGAPGYGAPVQSPQAYAATYVAPAAPVQPAYQPPPQAYPQPAKAYPQAAPQASAPVAAPAGGGARIEAELGAHSPSNFYKGLSGNDVVDHGGLFIATYNIPPIGQSITVHVSMPGGYEFDALAVVKWTRETVDSTHGQAAAPPGFGAQFTQITPEARQLVYRYVRNREPLFHDDL
jgi:hypothetical protein